MVATPYPGPWDLSPGGNDPGWTVWKGYAEVYRTCAEAFHMSPSDVDRTELWKLGAILRGSKKPEDETADVFAERIAAAEGHGPEPEARAMPMAQVIEMAQHLRGGKR